MVLPSTLVIFSFLS
jgi:hypothetical protein